MLDQLRELLLILIGSSLVSNVVLSQFLGLCPFLAFPKRWKPRPAWGLPLSL